jgi:hypothetical protein
LRIIQVSSPRAIEHIRIKLSKKSKLQGVKKMILRYITGPIIGGVLGFLYYKIVGCKTGSCPITSSPTRSIIYGAVMGLILA